MFLLAVQEGCKSKFLVWFVPYSIISFSSAGFGYMVKSTLPASKLVDT